MSDHWITPPEIIASLGGWRSFDLDPATPEVMPHRTARRRYTERDDGLFLPWFGRVWLNPPYSQPAIAHFLRRMALHNRGTALVFVRSDGSAWQEHVLRAASGLFFLLRKVKFFGVDGVRSKTGHFAPSVLAAYGPEDLDRLAALPRERGELVVLRLPRSMLIFSTIRDGDESYHEHWREIVARELSAREGPVHLADLYRAIATHPRARKNPHWRAKVRQQVQRLGVRVGPGQWEAA